MLWIAVMFAALAAFVALMRLFPGQISGAGWTDAAYLFGLLALVSSGLVAARRFDLAQTVRHGVLWLVLFAVALLGYSYRGEIAGTALRLRSELIPAYAVRTSSHTATISKSDDGFYINGAVNGIPLRFLIDTGSSDIVLSPADAQRLGLDLSAIKFSSANETANGVGHSAPFTAVKLTVPPFEMQNVPMQINQQPMSASLLGMPFLQRLKSYEIHGDRMTLTGR